MLNPMRDENIGKYRGEQKGKTPVTTTLWLVQKVAEGEKLLRVELASKSDCKTTKTSLGGQVLCNQQ